MTRAEMNTSLGYRLNDPGESRYTSTMKDAVLTEASNELVEKLPKSQLSELEVPSNGHTYGFTHETSLGYSILARAQESINIVRLVYGAYRDTTSGNVYSFRDRLLSEDKWKLRYNYACNNYRTPVWIELSTVIHIFPNMPSGHTLDLIYLRSHPNIGAAQNCILKVTLHSLVLQVSELILKNQRDQLDSVIQKYVIDLSQTVRKEVKENDSS